MGKPRFIGVFDSGVGGLSVWREIARQLPHEDTLYLADQAHVLYGSRRLAEGRELSAGTTHFLLEQRSLSSPATPPPQPRCVTCAALSPPSPLWEWSRP